MLKAYLDRGARPDGQGVMCVGAALFKPFDYDRFVHAWQPMLTEWGASAFHATDFYVGAGEFKRKRPDGSVDPVLKARYDRHSREIPGIIAAHVHKLFVVTFVEQEFEAVAPQAWRDRFGNVHRVAAQMMGSSIGHWAIKTGYEGEVAYFYETGDEEEASVDAAFRELYERPEQRKHLRMASIPIGIAKGKARGLEVADCLAWHWNKYAVETLSPTLTKLSKPRPTRKDTQALMDLMHEKGNGIDVRMFAGAKLEQFLIAHGCHRRADAAKPSSGS